MRRFTTLTAFVYLVGLAGWLVQPLVAEPPKPATDGEIKDMIKAAGEAKDYDDAAIVYVLDEADVYVQDSGLATTESCQVIKILTDAGIRSESVLRQEFDPDTNRVKFKAVCIHRKDGAIEEVPVSGTITQPAKQHMIYWGNEQHVLGIPRLEIGDSLEIRISKIGFNIAYLADSGGMASGGSAEETLEPPMPGHWYESTLFQGSYPIIKKRYSVHMPKDKPVQYEVYNGALRSSLWFGKDYHVYTWYAEDVPPVKDEPRMTSHDDNVTKLVMATIPDWPTKSRWFHEVNEPQFEADDAVRAKVAEITEGLQDEEAKIVACLHWVADNIRYYGTSRGPREGFTLHKGAEIFHDKGGVCKDIAGMLITMLRVLGHEVYPSLTMAGSRVERIPADQFNHTVCVMRKKDGTFRILDPTWAWRSAEVWSSWETLQGLVYGTPEGQDLTLSPYFPPEYSTLAYQGESLICKCGTLKTRIVVDASGSPGTSYRRSLATTPEPDRRAHFEEALHIAPNARLEKLDYTDPLDYSRHSQVKMEVSAAGYAMGTQGLRMFRLPVMSRPLESFISPDLNYPVDLKERQFGLRLRASRLLKIEETVKLPAGWKVVHVPEAKELKSGQVVFSFEATPGEGVLTYRLEMTIKNNIIPPEDYPGYKEAIETLQGLADEWVVCEVGGVDAETTAIAAVGAKEVDHD
ncbi:MAG: DUF3857 and transglutaminase domain-containing protein [Phycisphaerae bacterium]|nr:DUF3857 and transglutaminase domain-containing protein [Phycisphaerae bacterium]